MYIAKKINPDLKVIYTSGYTSNTIAPHDVLDQGIELIEKPAGADVLLRQLSCPPPPIALRLQFHRVSRVELSLSDPYPLDLSHQVSLRRFRTDTTSRDLMHIEQKILCPSGPQRVRLSNPEHAMILDFRAQPVPRGVSDLVECGIGSEGRTA